jgi:hypothetical protein
MRIIAFARSTATWTSARPGLSRRRARSHTASTWSIPAAFLRPLPAHVYGCCPIRGRGNLAILVGGTGLYLRASGAASFDSCDRSQRTRGLEARLADGGRPACRRVKAIAPDRPPTHLANRGRSSAPSRSPHSRRPTAGPARVPARPHGSTASRTERDARISRATRQFAAGLIAEAVGIRAATASITVPSAPSATSRRKPWRDDHRPPRGDVVGPARMRGARRPGSARSPASVGSSRPTQARRRSRRPAGSSHEPAPTRSGRLARRRGYA